MLVWFGESFIKCFPSKKAAKQNKGAYGWNRDKDLDAGRRVDKDALKVILGGGGNELKDKFQGGYGRS